jgi:UDP-N-acetylmuramoyl-tripeptide--D-alanyl-D-alanine ligase
VKGRCKPHRLAPLPGGAQARTLIDDSYNANPDSVRAAVALLAELPGPRWLLLGDMGEVGDQGPAFHAEAGALARRAGIEALWCAGDLSRAVAEAYGPGARYFSSAAEMVSALEGALPAFASALVKGSRFMKMEQLVVALLSRFVDKSAETPSAAAQPSASAEAPSCS